MAACACGLDPALGVLHADTANRDSLALDLIETIRPAIEAWILDWLMHEPLRRLDFIEATNGNCRLSSSLCSKLSETLPLGANLLLLGLNTSHTPSGAAHLDPNFLQRD